MCKITWKTSYKLAIVKSLAGAISGTVALSMGRNLSGCQPLWGWAVAVVVLAYIGAFSVMRTNFYEIEDKAKNYSKGKLICMTVVLGFPTIVLFIMGLIVVGNRECRAKWVDHNPVLLYFSIVYGSIWIFVVLLDLFFHECWNSSNDNNVVVVGGGYVVDVRPPIYIPSVPPPAYGKAPHYINEEGM